MARNNKNQKWHKCSGCGQRVWDYRPESHICDIPIKGDQDVSTDLIDNDSVSGLISKEEIKTLKEAVE